MRSLSTYLVRWAGNGRLYPEGVAEPKRSHSDSQAAARGFSYENRGVGGTTAARLGPPPAEIDGGLQVDERLHVVGFGVRLSNV